MELLPNVVFLPFLLLFGIVAIAVVGFFVSALRGRSADES